MPSNLKPIFISYRSDDLPIAEKLHELLAKDFHVWFDKKRLDPGCDWHKEIEAGCEAARVVLPVLTPRWRESVWTRYETYGAEQIIPLLFEGEFDKVAPPPLQGKQFIDLREPTEAKWQSLFDKIRKCLDQPAPEKLPRTAHLPLGHNEHFVGREALLDEIHEKLHQAPAATLTQSLPAFYLACRECWSKSPLARREPVTLDRRRAEGPSVHS